MKSVFLELLAENEPGRYTFDENVQLPELEEYDVLVQIRACGISSVESQILHDLHWREPRVLYPVGYEVAGVVSAVGSEVASVKVGDRITGLLSPSSDWSGCAEYCIIHEFSLVQIPDAVSFREAAACVGDGVRAYTALQYLGHMTRGSTVLVLEGASSAGNAAIQLAQHWGAKVLATASTMEGKSLLDSFQPALAQVVELTNKNHMLMRSVTEETGGMGVDIIIDHGVRMFNTEEDCKCAGEDTSVCKPSKHDVIACLGVGGRWITAQHALQLDPPDSQQLLLRGASVGFLFIHSWSLSLAHQGQFQHILRDLMDKVSVGVLRPNIAQVLPLNKDLPEKLQKISGQQIGKVIVELA